LDFLNSLIDILQNFIILLNQGWIGFEFGILGLILSVYFYFRSKQVTSLTCQINTIELIDVNSSIKDEITISFHDRDVSKLYKSEVTVWNSGNTTIKKSDVLDSDPLVFVFSEKDEVLRNGFVKTSTPQNNTLLNFEKGEQYQVYFEFEYLEPNDGAKIEFIHTLPTEPVLKGTILGMPSGILNISTLESAIDSLPFRLTNASISVVSGMLAFLLFLVYKAIQSSNILVAGFFAISLVMLLEVGRFYTSRNNIPDNLN